MTQTPEKVILGIDPGTSVLGYAAVRMCGKKCEMLAMGVIDLRKCKDVYLKLGRILERVASLMEAFHPDEIGGSTLLRKERAKHAQTRQSTGGGHRRSHDERHSHL